MRPNEDEDDDDDDEEDEVLRVFVFLARERDDLTSSSLLL